MKRHTNNRIGQGHGFYRGGKGSKQNSEKEVPVGKIFGRREVC